MGRQKDNPQRKEKEESPERELNDIETSSLSEKEFRVMVIRMFKRMDDKYTQLNDKYTQLNENYKELNENVANMKKNQEEMKNGIATIKNTVEDVKSRIEEAEDCISELEDKVGRNSQTQQQLERRLKKQEESLRELWDNTKRNNICLIGIPEGEEEKQEIENLFEEIMIENFPDIGKKKTMQVQEVHRVPNKLNPKRSTPRHIIIKLANTNNKWSHSHTVSKVLLSLSTMLCHPYPHNIIIPGIGKMYINDRPKYDFITQAWMKKYAM
ncbi:hypothetical protein QTO34_000577 [Cnephaeus nilssonii]|uniref:UBC core domain-containing protein n=1 Tax=Cnephaeus nilssonii TaxID=3371016 RepID=A0AA40IBM8_CNENI|nr:hypothetical protein QTO34_000577 [Eptesicus nilssonii]